MPPTDHDWMTLACRLAVRGHGGAEPNPMVGCVIVDRDGRLAGYGYHRRCGGPHAEIEALRRATDARDATVYVTLEPCDHTGRTGPCTAALIEAGVTRVVIGELDPGNDSGGGAERLRSAGIEVACLSTNDTRDLLAPFLYRHRTGLPWVIAKWAQTIDGRIATRTGVSQWISGPASRRLVHRERGRVDAIMTGIGTVLADDPRLTPRHGHVRRAARRVVVDPDLRTPLDCRLVRSAGDVPVTIATRREHSESADASGPLRDAGVEILGIDSTNDGLPLTPLLSHLSSVHEIATVLVEAGAGLTGRLYAEDLVNETWVFIAPMLLGDADAIPPVRGHASDHLDTISRLRLVDRRQREDDLVLRYRARFEEKEV